MQKVAIEIEEQKEGCLGGNEVHALLTSDSICYAPNPTFAFSFLTVTFIHFLKEKKKKSSQYMKQCTLQTENASSS